MNAINSCFNGYNEIQVQLLFGEFVYLKDNGRTNIEPYDRNTVFEIEATVRSTGESAIYCIGYAYSKEHADAMLQEFVVKNPEIEFLSAKLIEHNVDSFQCGKKSVLRSFDMEL